MPGIDFYLEHAEELAQQFVNTWGLHTKAGNKLSDDFVAVFNKACDYRNAKMVADNHRRNKLLSVPMAEVEQSTKQEFAEACKAYEEKQQQSVRGAGQR